MGVPPKRNIYSVQVAKREYLGPNQNYRRIDDYHLQYPSAAGRDGGALARLEAIKNSLKQKYEKLAIPRYNPPPQMCQRNSAARRAGMAVVEPVRYRVQPEWWG